ncbi:MAG: rhodanese-related sulfurtransferase, partial [Myxococcota bacterium]
PEPTNAALVQVRDVADSQNLLLVDVRSKEAFERGHLKGATRLAAHTLKISGAVRARNTVVISQGYGDETIAEAVVALREKGVKIRVLDGGFAAWCGAGLPVEGSCLDAQTISARTLRAGRRCADRAVVVATHSAQEETLAREILPNAVVLAAGADVRSGVLKALGPAGRVVAVLGADNATLSDVGAHVFHVAGGLDGYRKFRDQNAAMHARRTVISQGVRKTSTGRPQADTVRGEKGCGCM